MENHIVKNLNAAAEGAGRPTPRVVAGVPVGLTMRPDELREQTAKNLVIYGQLPSYRAMLDREGAAGPADIAILGDENALRGGIQQFENAGVTELNAAIIGEDKEGSARTLGVFVEFEGIGKQCPFASSRYGPCFVGLILVSCFSAKQANACKCVDATIEEQSDSADITFAGTVLLVLPSHECFERLS